ncbi:hypothetical protein HPB49_012289 [Dermacentor silvarum]|uniref:Uncharacterized protein n=1 Tax=Dermacentor silvarum TaxID=543639 RepID=A0ACB8CEW0_DERSI|nr:hypothetical protein HPB49_012289 [Dermacentor silvarum]
MREREPRPRLYAARNVLLNIDAIPDHTFRRQFRFEKEDFPVLVKALQVPDHATCAHGVRVSAQEALCMCLRRLAYPNRLCDLQDFFGRHYSVISSVSNKMMFHIERKFGFLLDDLPCHRWLTPADLRDMNNALMSANWLVCELDGPYPGSRHDAGILRESKLYEELELLVPGEDFVIYGDPAYPLRPLLMKPYGGARLTSMEEQFNAAMSAVRQCVEWGFAKIILQFAFVDFKKNQKLFLQAVPRMYRLISP